MDKNPIKKCSCCRELKTIFYQDYGMKTYINLCFNCSELAGFKVTANGFKSCPRCQDKFKGMKPICWVCEKKMSGGLK